MEIKDGDMLSEDSEEKKAESPEKIRHLEEFGQEEQQEKGNRFYAGMYDGAGAAAGAVDLWITGILRRAGAS